MRIEDHAEVTRLVAEYRSLSELQKEIADHGIHCTLSVPGKAPVRVGFESEQKAKIAIINDVEIAIERVQERLASLGVEV